MTDFMAFWVKKDACEYFSNGIAFSMRMIVFRAKKETDNMVQF